MAQLGGEGAVPMPSRRAVGAGLDHRQGFVLSFVDGQMTLEDVLDACGLPRVEVLEIVAGLVAQGVLVMRGA